ncbi:MAG: DUF4271 domain-containing protein [Bacteroidales bacterium]|nr:DUF4271 domain-containing protein [Bacteroidales bacterium]
MDVPVTQSLLPTDTLGVLSDSSEAALCVAHFPVLEAPAYEPAFEESLRSALDSNLFLQTSLSGGARLTQTHLLPPVSAREPLPRDAAHPSLFFLLLLAYLLLVAMRRFRLHTVMETFAGNRHEGVLPLFFASRHASNLSWELPFQFFTLCIGFSLCVASALRVTGNAGDTALAALACLLYLCGKPLLRRLSALLLDVQAQDAVFFRKKLQVCYNLLLLLVPLAFVYELYPIFRLPMVLAVAAGTICIYMLINAFIIFSKKMKGYGIFLYFCTLEIVPITLLIVYFLKYSIISI